MFRKIIQLIRPMGLMTFWVLADAVLAGAQAPAVQRHPVVNPEPLAGGVAEGGFSGLYHIPGDPAGVFYTICDRGPNGEMEINGIKGRTFLNPVFAPTIYKIELSEGAASITERIPIKMPEGEINPISNCATITGLPNFVQGGEIPYNGDGSVEVGVDPNGLDTEGLVFNPLDGTIWVSDEYGPSLVHLTNGGHIIERLVPEGMAARLGMSYAVDAIPASYGRRQPNRGFEGLAITPDGRYLYTSAQSPLERPDAKTAKKSRVIRILKIDLVTLRPAGEYVYLLDDAKPFDIKQKKILISDLYAIDGDRLLVVERDGKAGGESKIKRLYLADFSGARNIVEFAYSEVAAGTSLESLDEAGLQTQGFTPARKTLVLDMLAQGYPHGKLEGVCMIGKQTIAVINDNDFAFDYKKGGMILTGTPSEIFVYRLPAEIGS